MIEAMDAREEAGRTRGYDLRRRLEAMDRTRRSVLQAARRQLEEQGYRQMTMASLAAESGITRQTIHNLFGSKRGVLEALFDTMALEGGMERMRDVMRQPADPRAMLRALVPVFCRFWETHRLLFRRILGIGAIDPDFGEILEARNQRRHRIALHIAMSAMSGRSRRNAETAAASLAALTSFEFYDELVRYGQSAADAEAAILELALAVLNP